MPKQYRQTNIFMKYNFTNYISKIEEHLGHQE